MPESYFQNKHVYCGASGDGSASGLNGHVHILSISYAYSFYGLSPIRRLVES